MTFRKKCLTVSAKGNPCGRNAIHGSDYCRLCTEAVEKRLQKQKEQEEATRQRSCEVKLDQIISQVRNEQERRRLEEIALINMKYGEQEKVIASKKVQLIAIFKTDKVMPERVTKENVLDYLNKP